jgi:hypothetical protein
VFRDLLGESISEGDTVSFVSKRGSKLGMFVGRVEECFLHRGIEHVRVDPHIASIGSVPDHDILLTNLQRVVKI